MNVKATKRGMRRLLTSYNSRKNARILTDGFEGAMAGAGMTGRPMGAGPPIIPNEREVDAGAPRRAWFDSQPRASAKPAMAPPIRPSTMEDTKNAIANGQPNNPAL